jgi:hypothetical protein
VFYNRAQLTSPRRSDEEKSFIALSPGDNVIKLFLRDLRIFFKKASVFSNRMERLVRNKPSSLIRKVVNYRQTSFITFGRADGRSRSRVKSTNPALR